MDAPSKDANTKPQNVGNSSITSSISKNYSEHSPNCPSNIDCDRLTHPCITCNFTNDCNYGDMVNVRCSAIPNVFCNVSCGITP